MIGPDTRLPGIWRYVSGGLLAAALAAASNLVWRAWFTPLTGYEVPEHLGVLPVVLASVLSVLLAAGIYLLLSRALTIATPLYILGSLAVAAATCVAPLAPVLPDGAPVPEGFPLLAIPMHMLAGVMAAFVVPWIVLRSPPLRA